MSDTYELVKEFHKVMDQPIRTTPDTHVPEVNLRWELIQSEVVEFLDALFKKDDIEVADGLGDIVYVVDGAALTFGLGPIVLVPYDKNADDDGTMVLLLTIALSQLGEALAMHNPDLVRISLSMIKSACYSLAERKGWDLDEIIDVIHKSNLTKLGDDGKPVYITEGPEKGKVTKSANYVPPTKDIADILSRVNNGS